MSIAPSVAVKTIRQHAGGYGSLHRGLAEAAKLYQLMQSSLYPSSSLHSAEFSTPPHFRLHLDVLRHKEGEDFPRGCSARSCLRRRTTSSTLLYVRAVVSSVVMSWNSGCKAALQCNSFGQDDTRTPKQASGSYALMGVCARSFGTQTGGKDRERGVWLMGAAGLRQSHTVQA